uniref:Uncharacterized protein n=1 Tax=Arundo donax TaxID=35708 RepID=A0A0A8ZHF8_ARUDO
MYCGVSGVISLVDSKTNSVDFDTASLLCLKCLHQHVRVS